MTESKKKSQSLGSVWQVEAKERVDITLPGGRVVQVDPVDGFASLVLDTPGEYLSGESSVTAK